MAARRLVCRAATDSTAPPEPAAPTPDGTVPAQGVRDAATTAGVVRAQAPNAPGTGPLSRPESS
ncbi:MAG TPA: hypothetical protein VGP57_19440 [Actinoplanes sp.]|nr:hypothetical protein [Actinoplanes sp.]